MLNTQSKDWKVRGVLSWGNNAPKVRCEVRIVYEVRVFAGQRTGMCNPTSFLPPASQNPIKTEPFQHSFSQRILQNEVLNLRFNRHLGLICMLPQIIMTGDLN